MYNQEGKSWYEQVRSETVLQMSGPVQKGQSGGGKEQLADPGGPSPIDCVAMGTGVSAQMKGSECVCVWERENQTHM